MNEGTRDGSPPPDELGKGLAAMRLRGFDSRPLRWNLPLWAGLFLALLVPAAIVGDRMLRAQEPPDATKTAS
ncbi:MAG: hypothetical protein JO161_05230, partial [Planctomycetaceae bacterium]|nr:hypothetical protein [Planctomycetaceae bacterium]